MLERIRELIRTKNLTPSQFADEIGIQRSGISHLLSGRNNPSLEFVMKVLRRYPDVRPEWLLYGDESAGREHPAAEQPQIPSQAPQGAYPPAGDPSAGSLFDVPEMQETAPEPGLRRGIKKERTGKRIERIIVFYDDRSFREYTPEG